MKKSHFTDQQIAFAVQQAEAGVAVEEVCRKLGISQQTFYRWKKKYRRLHILLRREGWAINAKRVYRLYCEENLGLRTRMPKRRVSCRTRVGRPEPEQINDCWAMDFMADELFDGRRIRVRYSPS